MRLPPPLRVDLKHPDARPAPEESRTPPSTPHYEKVPQAILEQAHVRLLEALIAFARVCDEHSLTYWIDAGTLLGAARNGDFIPWDDDVDVAMPEADFDAFVALGSHSLGERYFVQTHRNDPSLRSNQVPCKIRVNGTHAPEKFWVLHGLPAPANDGLAVDVFPIARCPQRGWQLWLHHRFWLVAARKRRAAHMAKAPGLPPILRLKYQLVAHLPQALLDGLAAAEHRWLAGRGTGVRYGYALGSVTDCRATFTSEVLWPTTTIRFAGHAFRAPRDVDSYLQAHYGPDYLVPPPPLARRWHAWQIQLQGEAPGDDCQALGALDGEATQ